MGIVVRDARDSDLGTLAELEAKVPGAAGWSRAQLADDLGKPGRLVLAAELDGRVAGHAAARLGAPEAQLLTIAVDPKSGRRGVGTALLSALSSRARAAGCSSVTFEVSERNAPARAFYTRAGARVVGRRPKFYNDGAGAVLMDIML